MNTLNTLSTKNSNSQVNELKHLTLSIDRGITNEVGQKIIKITDTLGQQWQHDKVLSTFVKMIRALSDYAASGKININADVASLIHSIVRQMENLSTSPGINLPMSKKQAILSEEISKYNKLKQQIKSTTREQSPESAYNSDSDMSYQSEMDINVISDLKSVILSLDWEITDELIQKLEREVNKLQTHWQNSKIHFSFLQMFKSIGSYVLSKGSNTHPDSISLLNSLYKNFEQIVLNPAMSMAEQKEILLKEMKKFNDLKQIISSAKISRPRNDLNAPVFTSSASTPPSAAAVHPSPPAMNLMDDLMGTKKSSNLSPVDDLIEEIHMLQDSGDRTHSMDTNRVSHSSGGAPINPEIKEVIPNRLKKQPIEEIQTRLDAFFDEDEPLSEISFSDSGDEFVPYKGDTTTSGYATSELEQESDFNDDSALDMQGISFEDEHIEETTSIDQQPSEKSNVITDSMVPYDFENEFFEEDTDLTPSADAQKKQAINMQQSVEQQKAEGVLKRDIHTVSDIQMVADVEMEEANDVETAEAIELLESLKSAVGKSMFHCSVKEIKEINENISELEQLWKEQPKKLILLKMVKSLAGYFDLLAPAPEEQPLELMLYIVESMEDSGSQSTARRSSGVRSDEKSGNIDIIDVFSKYIDFQNTIVIRHPPAYADKLPQQENPSDRGETLADKEILYDRPAEDAPDIEKKITEPRGLWGKIKQWLGF